MEKNFLQQGGDLVMKLCRSARAGGGLNVLGHFEQTSMGSLLFNSCKARERGGCMSVGSSANFSSPSTNEFDGCEASGADDTGSVLKRGVNHVKVF